MTTDKIRVAAQALLDVLYDHRLIPGAKCAAMDALRAALAEPAQAAPADDAVPVVAMDAKEWAELYRLRESVKGPDGYALWQDAATAERRKRVDAERDHLAAMEALRQEIAYHEAQDGLLSTAQDEVARLRSELAEVKRPLDAQMARLNESLITANEQAAALRQENERLKAENFALAAGQCIVPGGLRGDESGNQYCSLKANRSAQVAEVMRAVDEFSVAAGMSAIGVSEGVVRGSPDHAILEQRFTNTRTAVESAVRKLAGGA